MIRHQEVYVIGAGGHSKVVVSALQTAGYHVKALFDDDPKKWETKVLDAPVVGGIAEFARFSTSRAVVAIGDNATRKAVARRFAGSGWVTVIHPRAYVHSSVRLGEGTVVFAGAVVQPDAVVGSHCIINTGASVDHDCIIGDYVHVAPGARLGGGVELKEGVFLGIGSAVVPGVRLGSWTVVGAGGVVTCDLDARTLAVGVPARPIERRGQS